LVSTMRDGRDSSRRVLLFRVLFTRGIDHDQCIGKLGYLEDALKVAAQLGFAIQSGQFPKPIFL
jgi:hypothetical protein